MRGFSTYAGSAAVAVADQMLASGIAFGLLVLLARASSSEVFGQIALALALYNAVVGLHRATVSSFLLIRSGRLSADARADAVATAGGQTLVMGLVGGALLASGGALWSNVPPLWLVLGIALPGLLLADLARHVGLAQLRPMRALGLDALWLTLTSVGLGWIGVDRPLSILLVWSGAGVVVGLAGLLSSEWPALSLRALRTYGSERSVRQFGTEYAAGACMAHLGIVMVASLGGLGAAGALRGIATLFGPVNVAYQALVSLAIARISRNREHARLTTVLVVVLLLTATAATAVVIRLVPPHTGRSLLGETWDTATALLWPFTAFIAAGCLTVGCYVVLRARESRRSLAATFKTSTAILVGTVTGTVLGGAYGAATGMALGQSLVIPVWLAAVAGDPQHDTAGDAPWTATVAEKGLGTGD